MTVLYVVTGSGRKYWLVCGQGSSAVDKAAEAHYATTNERTYYVAT